MLTLDQAGAGVGLTRRVRPPPSLGEWVEEGWIQGARSGGGDGGWKIVPDPSPHLVVAARDGPRGWRVRAVLVGARSRAAEAGGERAQTVGVRLRPGVLPLIAGDDARAVTDRSVPLDAVLPAAALRPLRSADPRDGAATLNAIWRLLVTVLDGAPAVDWRVRALTADPLASPREVSERAGVSPRGMRGVAATAVGLSPGELLRVRRLQLALSLRLWGSAASWAEAALAAGFHDPAHLVRTSRALLGETPETFRGRGTRGAGACRFVQCPGGDRAPE